MPGWMQSVVASGVLWLVACGKDSARCDHYVDMEIRCEQNVAEQYRERGRATATAICEMALDRKGEDASGERGELARFQHQVMREHIKCADTANTCDELARCKDQALATALGKRR